MNSVCPSGIDRDARRIAKPLSVWQILRITRQAPPGTACPLRAVKKSSARRPDEWTAFRFLGRNRRNPLAGVSYTYRRSRKIHKVGAASIVRTRTCGTPSRRQATRTLRQPPEPTQWTSIARGACCVVYEVRTRRGVRTNPCRPNLLPSRQPSDLFNRQGIGTSSIAHGKTQGIHKSREGKPDAPRPCQGHGGRCVQGI